MTQHHFRIGSLTILAFVRHTSQSEFLSTDVSFCELLDFSKSYVLNKLLSIIGSSPTIGLRQHWSTRLAKMFNAQNKWAGVLSIPWLLFSIPSLSLFNMCARWLVSILPVCRKNPNLSLRVVTSKLPTQCIIKNIYLQLWIQLFPTYFIIYNDFLEVLFVPCHSLLHTPLFLLYLAFLYYYYNLWKHHLVDSNILKLSVKY